MKKVILFCLFIFVLLSPLRSIEKFYNYYDNGLEFMGKGDWLRAIEEFKSAASLEFEDKKKKRTYGTRFIKYFPHREIGIAYYNLGEFENAKKELELSLAYKKSKRAEEYLQELDKGEFPIISLIDLEKERLELEKQQKLIEEEKKLAEEKKAKEELEKRERELEKKRKEIERKKLEEEKKRALESSIILSEKLNYDPLTVTQVGSRLSVAVLPFEFKGEAGDIELTATEKLITQLVNLRRFRVIERGAMDKIMEEQAFGISGMVDEETAVEVGKLAGADVIILASIYVVPDFGKVSARGIDTETSEAIVAKEVQTNNPDLESIEELIENLAVMIYNDLPIVEGLIVQEDEENIYIDIGSSAGVRKGTKCVIFREGKEIVHPVTKEVIGKEVTKLGELVITHVQEKMSIARIVEKEGKIEVGDKVVVK